MIHGSGQGRVIPALPLPSRIPWLTGVLVALAWAVAAIPGASSALALERNAVAAGEWWRIFSGHWVHWSSDHLLWDATTFAALGAACELRSRRSLLACVACSALAISAGFWWGLPQLSQYGGLSGIDCALFARLCGELWRDRRRSRTASALAAAPALALLAKVGFEWTTGSLLFVSQLGRGAVPVPAAHAVGVVIGLASTAIGPNPPERSAIGSLHCRRCRAR